MAFPKTPGIKKPKFGGKAKTKTLPPDKKTLESFGGARTKMQAFEPRVSAQQETGFIQATPKQATGAMMGRRAAAAGGEVEHPQGLEEAVQAQGQEGVLRCLIPSPRTTAW